MTTEARARERIDVLDALRLPMRAAIAAGGAVGIALYFQLGSPLYALVSAVIVTDLDPAKTRRNFAPRMLGTAIGAGVGCIASLLVQPGAATVALGVLVSMFVCQLLRQPAAARLAGYVSGITLLNFSTNPWLYARDRLLETLLGIALAAAVSLLPVLHHPAKQDAGAG